MSNPKPFLEPDDVYARIKELERIVKAMHTTPRTQVSTTVAQEIATNQGSLPIDANWHDLATPGPTCSVKLGSSGIVIVIASTNYFINLDSNGTGGVNTAISIDGATPITSDVAPATYTTMGDFGAVVGVTAFVRVYTLTPNVTYTFRMKYQNNSGAGESWYNRSLVCIPL